MSKFYDDGFEAGRFRPITECPYEKGSFEYDQWQLGYKAGARDRAEIM